MKKITAFIGFVWMFVTVPPFRELIIKMHKQGTFHISQRKRGE